MREITYICNLCGRDELSSEATKHFKSFYWKSDKIPQGYILSNNLDSCDKHICKDCINTIIEQGQAIDKTKIE